MAADSSADALAGPKLADLLEPVSIVAGISVIAVVALGYAGAPITVVLSALGVMAATAWCQNDRRNVLTYVALLGVQTWLPGTGIDLPFRLAVADFFLVPVIVRSAWQLWRRTRPLPVTTLGWPLLALAVVMAIATLVGISRTGELPAYVWFSKDAGILFLIAGFFAMACHLRTPGDVRLALAVFVIGGSVVNALALVAAVLSVTAFANPVFQVGNARLYGWMLNPSSYGSFVVTVAMLELGRRSVVDTGPRWLKSVRWVNYALLLTAVALTLSRSVWLAMGAGAGAVLISAARRRRLAWTWPRSHVMAACVTAIAPAALLVWILTVHWQQILAMTTAPDARAAQLQSQLAGICVTRWDAELCGGIPRSVIQAARDHRDGTVDVGLANDAARSAAPATLMVNPDSALMNSRGLEDRTAILRVAWHNYTASAGSMLAGIGLGTFYSTSARQFGVPLIIHNTAAWLLIEMGPFGLAVLAWIVVRTTRNLVHVRVDTGGESDQALGLSAALAAWLAFSMFNEALYNRHLWLLLVCADRLFALTPAVRTRPVWSRQKDAMLAGLLASGAAVAGVAFILVHAQSAPSLPQPNQPSSVSLALAPSNVFAPPDLVPPTSPDLVVAALRPPYPAPGWRWTSEQYWFNDLSNEMFHAGDPLPHVPDPGAENYHASFDQGAENWQTILRQDKTYPTKVGWNPAGHLESAGPWWVNTNQYSGGTGAFNLVAFVNTGGLLPHSLAREINFTDATLTITLRGHGVQLRGAHLVLWVQARPVGSSKSVNLALVGQPLDEAIRTDRWSTVKLQLPADAGWRCMGANQAMAEQYGCAPTADVLRDVNRDVGLIIYPLSCPHDCNTPEEITTGTIDIDNVTLSYRLTPRP